MYVFMYVLHMYVCKNFINQFKKCHVDSFSDCVCCIHYGLRNIHVLLRGSLNILKNLTFVNKANIIKYKQTFAVNNFLHNI